MRLRLLDYFGVRLVVAAALADMLMNTHAADQIVIDFGIGTNTVAWQVVNDDVMGGVSKSRTEMANGAMVFLGEVSLQNNGGFASVRSLPLSLNLRGWDTFLIRARGDGHRYKFTARMGSSPESPVYQAAFATATNEWAEYTLPFKDFVPSLRGRVLTGEPPLDPAKIVSVGFLISDKQKGPFRLEVAWIKAVGPQQKRP